MDDIKPRTKAKNSTERHFNPKIDMEAYNHVAKHSQLATVQLISNHFDVYPGYFRESDNVNYDLCHSILGINVYADPDDGDMIAGFFRYEFIAKKSRKHLLNIRADFIAAYDLPKEFEDNEAKAFCARVGLFAAYPYFRSLVATISSSANLDLPIMPVLSADPLRRSRGKQSTIKAGKNFPTKNKTETKK